MHKFQTKIGDKTLSVTYYQDTRLRNMKGLKKGVKPIYLRIVFDRVTVRVRSIMWRRIVESHRDFLFSLVFKAGEAPAVIEGQTDLERAFISNKSGFAKLCEYEFECLKRIIVFAHQSRPSSVHDIINSYNEWGTDGLRQICEKYINKVLTATGGNKLDKANITRGIQLRPYKGYSLSLHKSLKDLASTYDPVTMVCLLDELKFLDSAGDLGTLERVHFELINLIGKLTMDSIASYNGELGDSSAFLQYGLYYFPKIHFFYPPIGDMSSRKEKSAPGEEPLKAIDFLKLQKFLSLR